MGQLCGVMGVWGDEGVMNLEGSCWQVAQLSPGSRLISTSLATLPPCLLRLQAAPFLSLHLPLWQEPR